jgi:hypothetical protein
MFFIWTYWRDSNRRNSSLVTRVLFCCWPGNRL